MVHQPAASTAIGGVIQQWHTSALQQRNRIAPAQLLKPAQSLLLVRFQTRRMLPAPRGAVVVLQHQLHRHASAVALDQGLSNGRQGELLNRHQHFPLSAGNGGDELLLKVVASAPLTRQRADVAAAEAVVEARRDELRLRQGGFRPWAVLRRCCAATAKGCQRQGAEAMHGQPLGA